MSDRPPTVERITGGSHGVAAGYEAMTRLALLYDRVGDVLRALAATAGRVMTDDDLLQSSVLSPGSFARAQQALLTVAGGPEGLLLRSLDLEVDAVAVRAVVAAFRTSDAFGRQLAERMDHAVGRVAPLAALAVVPLVAPLLPALLARGATMTAGERQHLLERLGRGVHQHPGVVEHLVNGGGGVVDVLAPGSGVGWVHPTDGGPPFRGTTNDAARLLALLLGRDGVPVVEQRPVPPVPGDLEAPGSLADLIRQLERTHRLDEGDPRLAGAVQIQQLGNGPDSRYVVYIPGTDDMAPLGRTDPTVRDMATNYRLVGGLDTTYAAGVREALSEAGLSGRKVMLVGHSQGGMVATALAADPQFRKEFDLAHVVTAGSPTAQVRDLPDDVGVIHLENRGDLVPLLDGEPNPDGPRRVTVRFDGGPSDLLRSHELDRYVDGAEAADHSRHGSVRHELDSMRKGGFLDGSDVEDLRTYTIRRGG